MILHPRTTLAELVQRPRWVDTWLVILLVVAACGAALLATDIGRQALIDERVRVIESFGGSIDDEQYAALQRNPPLWVYAASGNRLLLTPVFTLAVAIGCLAIARADGSPARFSQALSIAVHASIALAVGQLVATPLSFVRESLTSPLNLAAVLPLMEEGTIVARVFGTIDIFALWWLALLALGVAAMTRRKARRYGVAFATAYLGFAAVMAGVIAALGGT